MNIGRDRVDIGAQAFALLTMYSAAECLIGKAHIHHAGGVASADQIDQAAFTEQVNGPAIDTVLFDEQAHELGRTTAHLCQSLDVSFRR